MNKSGYIFTLPFGTVRKYKTGREMMGASLLASLLSRLSSCYNVMDTCESPRGPRVINIAICDDEDAIAAQIEDIIQKLSKDKGLPVETDVFLSGEKLEERLLSGIRYDLLFLDIQMEGRNGLELAKNIHEMDENAIIVFVSAHEAHVWDSFAFSPLDFIRKPIKEAAVDAAFTRACKKIHEMDGYYFLSYKGVESKFSYKDILYFESRARKIFVNVRNGERMCFNGQLDAVEKELAKKKTPFIRIHKSYLVNYHMVMSISKSEVILIDKQKLTISESYREVVGRQYTGLLGGEIRV